MIVMLTPGDISERWDILKERLLKLPNVNDNRIPSILQKLIDGQFQCWVHQNDTGDIKGSIITSFVRDPILGHKSLFVYAMFLWERISFDQIRDDFDHIKLFAKNNQCKFIVSTSPSDFVIDLCNNLGADTSCRYIVFNLEE